MPWLGVRCLHGARACAVRVAALLHTCSHSVVVIVLRGACDVHLYVTNMLETLICPLGCSIQRWRLCSKSHLSLTPKDFQLFSAYFHSNLQKDYEEYSLHRRLDLQLVRYNTLLGPTCGMAICFRPDH
jgi:hypothetical protein